MVFFKENRLKIHSPSRQFIPGINNRFREETSSDIRGIVCIIHMGAREQRRATQKRINLRHYLQVPLRLQHLPKD